MQTTLIVALDKPKAEEALALVDRLGEDVLWYKVGLELFLNSRGTVIDELKARGKKVFMDLKFHDISNTVAAAATWAAGAGVDMFNVHAGGGVEMMHHAMTAMQEEAERKALPKPILIGVTVLTSLDQKAIHEIGWQETPEKAVLRLAQLSQTAGLDGVVCSSQEVVGIQSVCGKDFVTVCPGIRPRGARLGDQKRVMTPAEAKAVGVHYIVVGRPITQAEDPVDACRSILAELEA